MSNMEVMLSRMIEKYKDRLTDKEIELLTDAGRIISELNDMAESIRFLEQEHDPNGGAKMVGFASMDKTYARSAAPAPNRQNRGKRDV